MNFIDLARQRSDMKVLDRSTDKVFDIRILDGEFGACKITIDENGETIFSPKDNCSRIMNKLENNGGVE